ncbi:MAG: thioesterase [Alphaproteobacteria bacterium]|nr:thioesterase [Alphaproteobacteria bacterium]
MSQLIFEKIYHVRTYEVDKNCNMRIVTLFNIFQDMADHHAEALGLGLSFCLEKGFAWVGSNYHLLINRLPKIHEKIRIQTWPSEEKKFGAVRDFIVFDEQGNTLITASSLWVLINYARRRPILLKENLPDYTVNPERTLATEFPKLPEISEAETKTAFTIRYDDIDLNNHVNNAVYPLWATESVEKDFHLEHTLRELEIEFKKEALLGEHISVETKRDNLTSFHSIKAVEDGRELSRVKLTWQKN